MAPIDVRIEVYGDDVTAEQLVATGERAVMMEPLWAEISERLEEIEREQFATDGGRGGRRWPELAMNTMWRKFREHERLDILRATDDMYESLTEGGPQAVRFMTPDSFEFGSTTEQFGLQQGWTPQANFPERLPVDLTIGDELMFSRMMLEYIVGGTDSLGRPFRRNPSTGRFMSLS